MNHEDHVNLIRAGIPAASGGEWADMGSGSGAFTLALRELAGSAVKIWSLDRDAGALKRQRAAFERMFPGAGVQFVSGDIERPRELPPLDGIVAANSIHYIDDQVALLRRWRLMLKPGGQIIVVEYDTDRGNTWVPFPLSLGTLDRVAREAGFSRVKLLGTHPSQWHNRMYSASIS